MKALFLALSFPLIFLAGIATTRADSIRVHITPSTRKQIGFSFDVQAYRHTMLTREGGDYEQITFDFDLPAKGAFAPVSSAWIVVLGEKGIELLSAPLNLLRINEGKVQVRFDMEESFAQKCQMRVMEADYSVSTASTTYVFDLKDYLPEKTAK